MQPKKKFGNTSCLWEICRTCLFRSTVKQAKNEDLRLLNLLTRSRRKQQSANSTISHSKDGPWP
jgi:hypothetical protein